MNSTEDVAAGSPLDCFTSESSPSRSSSGGSVIFWTFQLAFVSLAIWGSASLARSVNNRPAMPQLRDEPRQITPQQDLPFVASDRQLATVLKKVLPRFNEVPKVNFVDHALRLWGTHVSFDSETMSGVQLRSSLTNAEVFKGIWGENEAPLLIGNGLGIAVRTQEGRASVSHVDHLLASLAEVGTPQTFPVQIGVQKTHTVRELVHHALSTLSLNQQEYEWTVLALSLYCDQAQPWVTSEGQQIDFDLLAKRIMRQQQPQGVCYGQHRLYTLATMLRIDDQIRDENSVTGIGGNDKGLLTIDTRLEVIQYLIDITSLLCQNQNMEGFWDANWPDPMQEIRDLETDPLSRRILATGHTLEWWAIAPLDVQPPRDTVVRAGQWLVKVIGEMNDDRVIDNYTFLTHAARALCLWRGAEAADQWKRLQTTGHTL